MDLLTIPQIQGIGFTSFFVESGPVTVQCVVTAVDSNLFYCQDQIGDGNDATSDAISVFTGSAPSVTVGDFVAITGSITEFTGVGADLSDSSQTRTQFASPDAIVTITTGNALPAPVVIGRSGRIPPSTSLIEYLAFWESLEDMLVTIEDPITVSATSFGETYIVANRGVDAPTLSSTFGVNVLTPDNFGPPAILLEADSTISPTSDITSFNAGTVLEDINGIVVFDPSNFLPQFGIVPTSALVVVDAPIPIPTVTSFTATGNTLLVGSYNVENLDPSDDRFQLIAGVICTNMGTPDVIGLQEIQDNSGTTNDGVIAADVTLQMLVDAIVTECSVTYEFLDNPFILDGFSGGEPGGNIRVAYLYNPNRVSLVGSVETVTEIPQSDSNNPFFGSRLPLVATFTFNPTGTEFIMINNHFSSKFGSAPIQGFFQPFEQLQNTPFVNGGVDERLAQATGVREFIESLPNADNVIVLGDLNEFEFVEPVQLLVGAGLRNLVESIDLDDRFSITFGGNAQVLDHILVGPAFTCDAEAQFIHTGETIFFFGFTDTPSDHDPIVAAIDLSPPTDSPTSSPTTSPVSSPTASPVTSVPFCCTYRFNLCVRDPATNDPTDPLNSFCNESENNCLGPCNTNGNAFWFPLVEDPNPAMCGVRLMGGCSTDDDCCGPLECRLIENPSNNFYMGCEVPENLIDPTNPNLGIQI